MPTKPARRRCGRASPWRPRAALSPSSATDDGARRDLPTETYARHETQLNQPNSFRFCTRRGCVLLHRLRRELAAPSTARAIGRVCSSFHQKVIWVGLVHRFISTRLCKCQCRLAHQPHSSPTSQRGNHDTSTRGGGEAFDAQGAGPTPAAQATQAGGEFLARTRSITWALGTTCHIRASLDFFAREGGNVMVVYFNKQRRRSREVQQGQLGPPRDRYHGACILQSALLRAPAFISSRRNLFRQERSLTGSRTESAGESARERICLRA